MNIVIPMAGEGQRFSNEGYQCPKPLIEIEGETMIQCAIRTLGIIGRYIFIVRKYENKEFNIKLHNALRQISSESIIIEIDYLTDGPASTCLLAEKYIDNDDSLVIANCDQIMDWDAKDFIYFAKSKNLDGVVVTYLSNTLKNSYIKIDENGHGVELAEKRVISNHSLNGIHYWKKGSDFVKSSKDMIRKDLRTNNEFYIAPTYNEMISDNKKIGIYEILRKNHHPVGTPEDLNLYLAREKINENFKNG